MHHWWAELKRGRPGHRFQDRYEQAARNHDRQHVVVRVLKIIGAVLAILVGVAEIVFPGPAFVFLIVGGGMLATESRTVARFMDFAEVRARRLWHWVTQRWHKSGPALRSAVLGAFVCVVAGGAFVAWRVVFR